jgi:NTE family protein
MQEEAPLRIGVALGAGSAAALAEIGALEVLDEAGIPVHAVAGTSAGAIVGAAFAGGKLPALRDELSGLSRRGVLRLFDPAWPRQGLLHGRRGLEFVRPSLGERIEDLARPYAAVATELRSGEEVLLSRGPVFDAVRASIAVPGIFTPWRVGGRLLVDGGLVDPVPVSAAKALGAGFVIALNVLPLRDAHQTPRSLVDHLRLVDAAGGEEEAAGDGATLEEQLGLVEVVWRASHILASQVASSRLREDPPGYLVQIDVPEVGMFDLHRTPELVEVGRRATEAALPRLLEALDRALPLGQRLRDWWRKADTLPTDP